MGKKIFFVTLIFIGSILLIWAYDYKLNSHETSESQESTIEEVVNDYYKALENKQFEKALSYCLLDKKNNDLHMDVDNTFCKTKKA